MTDELVILYWMLSAPIFAVAAFIIVWFVAPLMAIIAYLITNTFAKNGNKMIGKEDDQ